MGLIIFKTQITILIYSNKKKYFISANFDLTKAFDFTVKDPQQFPSEL